MFGVHKRINFKFLEKSRDLAGGDLGGRRAPTRRFQRSSRKTWRPGTGRLPQLMYRSWRRRSMETGQLYLSLEGARIPLLCLTSDSSQRGRERLEWSGEVPPEQAQKEGYWGDFFHRWKELRARTDKMPRSLPGS